MSRSLLDGVLIDAEVDVIVDESEVGRTQRCLMRRMNRWSDKGFKRGDDRTHLADRTREGLLGGQNRLMRCLCPSWRFIEVGLKLLRQFREILR